MNFIDKHCPYCEKITNTEDINNSLFESSNAYLEILKKKYTGSNSISFDEFVEKNLKLAKCEECKIIFFKKWFDSETVKIIYNARPHRVGWGSFNLFYDQSERLEKYIDKKTIIFNCINKKIDRIDNYAEINCPFSGLMLLFNFAKKNYNFKLNILQNLIKERSFFNDILLKIFNRVRVLFLNYLLIQEKIKIKISKKNKYFDLLNKKKRFEIPVDIRLIKIENNNLSWNYNCNNMGQNCRKIFTYFEDFKSVTFNEVEDENKKNNFKFDLSYLENTIDHVSDIKKTLSKLSALSKNIAIITHGIKAGPQHSYFLNEEFISNYSKLNGFKLNILTNEITSRSNNEFDNQYYLLTKLN